MNDTGKALVGLVQEILREIDSPSRIEKLRAIHESALYQHFLNMREYPADISEFAGLCREFYRNDRTSLPESAFEGESTEDMSDDLVEFLFYSIGYKRKSRQES